MVHRCHLTHWLVTALLCASVRAHAWELRRDFAQGQKEWRLWREDPTTEAKLTVLREAAHTIGELSVSASGPGIGSLDTTFSLPAGPGLVCTLTADIRTIDVSGRSVMVTVFRGGQAAGNNEWNVTPIAVDDASWQRVKVTRTLPPDARFMEVKLRLDGSGRMQVRQVVVRSIAASTGSFPLAVARVDAGAYGNTLTPLHFAVNAPYYFPGIHGGTLPAEEAGSRSGAFARALREHGIRALRFPGGTACQWYLPGRREQTVELNRRLHRLSGDPERDWPRGHIPKWREVTAFARQTGVAIIYQLNTCFFVDETGAVRATNDNHFAKRAGLADGANHADQAAAALDRLFDDAVFRPGDVAYWEIGNEDYSQMTAQEYASVAAAFAGVLSRRDPGRPICFTGGPWKPDIAPLLLSAPKASAFTGITTHYPFSRWPGPTPAIATADYESLAATDVGFPRALNAFRLAQGQGRLPARLHISVSETGVYKYWRYDPFRATCSFAHALAFAANWPKLISHPGVDMAVYHSLESTFFGLLMHHVEFDQLSRRFDWLPPEAGRPGHLSPPHYDDARQRLWFPRQYVPTPTARVFGLLSELGGATARPVIVEPAGKLVGALAGRAEGRSLLFVCNRSHEPVRLRFSWPKEWPPPARGEWRMVDADSVYAALPREYRTRRLTAPLPGQGHVSVLLPALSAHLFQWRP